MSAAEAAQATAPARPAGIDPRGPRFVAGLTAVVLLVALFLGLVGAYLPALVVLGVLVAIFLWSAIAGIRLHPFALLFRAVVRPRLKPPAELEDPRPPTFAQIVGFIVTAVGFVIALVGGPALVLAIVISAAAAFIAAFLNAAFGLCLGCELYLLLVRARIIRQRPIAA